MSVYTTGGFNNRKIGAKDNLVSYLIKPAIAATIGGVASHYMHPGQSINILGHKVSRSVMTGAGFALGTIATDVAHDHILPHIVKSKKFQSIASILLSAGVNVGTIYAIHGLVNAKTLAYLSMTELAAEGAAITVATDWITDRFIVPMIA